jgi:hypothetical protein
MTIIRMRKDSYEFWEHKCSNPAEELIVWLAWSLWYWDCYVWREDFSNLQFA